MSWLTRLRRWAPITHIAMESVRFDTQLMENAEISGVEYQQGTLAGYEVREYLLEKHGRHCAYCPAVNVPLTVEHIIPKAKGGSDRVSNLTIACTPCNTAKDKLDIQVFLADRPELLKSILAGTKRSLASAAAVNATRNELLRQLQSTGLPVETGTGGKTKWNRSRFGILKTHANDAACVGDVEVLTGADIVELAIKAMGRGSHKRTRLTKHGFPRGYLSPRKSHFGFRTGDCITANVTRGAKLGRYTGRVAVRATGNFNIQTNTATVQGISHRFCVIHQKADGYAYTT